MLVSLPATFAHDFGRVTPAGWAALLWAVILPLYLAWTMWAWASARVGVGQASVFMFLVPIVGGVASRLLLGEGFGPLNTSGAALALGGLLPARNPATRAEDGVSSRR